MELHQFAVRPLRSGTIFIRDLFVDDVTISVITGGDLQTDERYESPTESPPEMVIPIIESVMLRNIVTYLYRLPLAARHGAGVTIVAVLSSGLWGTFRDID